MEKETRLIVRMATPRDGAGCAAIYGPIVEKTTTSFELEAPSPIEMGERIQKTLERYPWLVCEAQPANGTAEAGGIGEPLIVGYTYGTMWKPRPAYQWTTEVAIYVHEQWRGRGVGKMLYGELFHQLRAGNFHTAVAAIALPNVESIGLHLSFGFRSVGVFHEVGYKLGRWVDVAWFERPIQSE